ncbi:beta-defensin 38-like [Apodemus sylvaticus]|uniref:beta-defensin 38-like n=1 Tax=Apodemus sylvaticus TaxID=10129 RepID=UPI0022449378|nr:beta-defensin 38-like [Apodemus sylvaticus]
MKICFLLLILSMFFFQINQAFGRDTKECIQRKGFCHYFECPWLYNFAGTCYKGKGKCCQKRY